MDYPLESTIVEAHIVRIKRIKAGSLFGLIVTALFSFLAPLIILCGVLALFGGNTITMNGEHLTGFSGLCASLVMAPLFSLVFGIFIWFAVYAGIFIRGLFGPITIKYVPAERQATPPARGA